MEGETFRATIQGEIDDGSAVVFDFGYFDSTSGSGHVDTGTAAGDFQTKVQARIVAALPDTYTVRRYRFACVGGTSKGEIGFVDVSPPVAGALSTVTAPMPNEICISIKRATGYASRGDRGRIFFGPVADDIVAGNGPNKYDMTNTALLSVRDLLKEDFLTQGRTLRPVLLRPNGTCNGHLINRVGLNPIFAHRRTRRPRQGS